MHNEGRYHLCTGTWTSMQVLVSHYWSQIFGTNPGGSVQAERKNFPLKNNELFWWILEVKQKILANEMNRLVHADRHPWDPATPALVEARENVSKGLHMECKNTCWTCWTHWGWGWDGTHQWTWQPGNSGSRTLMVVWHLNTLHSTCFQEGQKLFPQRFSFGLQLRNGFLTEALTNSRLSMGEREYLCQTTMLGYEPSFLSMMASLGSLRPLGSHWAGRHKPSNLLQLLLVVSSLLEWELKFSSEERSMSQRCQQSWEANASMCNWATTVMDEAWADIRRGSQMSVWRYK